MPAFVEGVSAPPSGLSRQTSMEMNCRKPMRRLSDHPNPLTADSLCSKKSSNMSLNAQIVCEDLLGEEDDDSVDFVYPSLSKNALETEQSQLSTNGTVDDSAASMPAFVEGVFAPPSGLSRQTSMEVNCRKPMRRLSDCPNPLIADSLCS